MGMASVDTEPSVPIDTVEVVPARPITAVDQRLLSHFLAPFIYHLCNNSNHGGRLSLSPYTIMYPQDAAIHTCTHVGYTWHFNAAIL